ncbi:hypothetical protein CYLTODRAFT_420897 [Cylindrobasidium torrendii FP15055 ss-10]|uniref:MARVEL domain-containing protein n=1 Tax=Cylindrobasidium torrendii FP15055 ss-10 TaxID=1314674 RepID=A0A0D7BFM9_9AGAR|nr:hypothetical protein CYLTODRAFT_420897 [Cylindrobasidium torrendii FP15055 ss-10]
MAYYKAPLYSLYALHWASAVVLVALSAQLIDWNWYRHDHKEMPILEELLVSAAMSIFWVIVSIATIEIGSGVVKWFSFEVLGAVWMWIMYLVGAAYFTVGIAVSFTSSTSRGIVDCSIPIT